MIKGIQAVSNAFKSTARYSSWSKRMNDRIFQVAKKLGKDSQAYQNIEKVFKAHPELLNKKSSRSVPQLLSGKKSYNLIKSNPDVYEKVMAQIENQKTAGEVMKHEKRKLSEEGFSFKNQKELEKAIRERNKMKKYISEHLDPALEKFYKYKLVNESGEQIKFKLSDKPTVKDIYDFIKQTELIKTTDENETSVFDPEKAVPFWNKGKRTKGK